MSELELLFQAIIQNIKKRPSSVGLYVDAFGAAAEVAKTDTSLAVGLCRELMRYTRLELSQASSAASLEALYSLYRTQLKFASPHDFDSYLRFVEFELDPDKKFYLPRIDALECVVKGVQALADDHADLLCVSMPPGTGKSTMGEFALSWFCGREPDKPNLASSYSGTITKKFYADVLTIMTDKRYLWGEVFSQNAVFSTDAKDLMINLNHHHPFATLTCRAINASLTGATRCEGVLYADDLVSGIEEALSPERLDILWDKYVNDLKSRKKVGAKEFHIATRWSVHDVIGRLGRDRKGDPRSIFITLPALNEAGNSNFDYPYGVGFDTAYFEDMKNTLDKVSWLSLYQNEPRERAGLLYSEGELMRYTELPAQPPDAVIAIYDTKDRGPDYAFMPVDYIYGDKHFIADCVCDNRLPEMIQPDVVAKMISHGIEMCRVESNAAGGTIADDVQASITERGGITAITRKYSSVNKETRILANSPWVKRHCLFLSEECYKKGSQYATMMEQMTSYTLDGRNPHDDVVDGLAMLAKYAQGMKDGIVEVFQRPF